jgi:PAS domain S-box-containing protein
MRLPSLSIRNRIALLVIGVVCGVTMALLLLVRVELLPEVRQQADRSLRDAVRSLAENLVREIEDEQDDVVHYAEAVPVPDGAEGLAAQRQWLASLMANEGDYAWLGIVAPDDTVLVGANGRLEGRKLREGLELGDEPDVSGIADPRRTVLPGAPDGKPLRFLRLAAPIRAAEGRALDMLMALIDEGEFLGDAQRIADRLEAETGARIWLVDREDRTRLGGPLPAWMTAPGDGSIADDPIAESGIGKYAIIREPVPPVAGTDMDWRVVLAVDLERIEMPFRRVEQLLLAAGGLAVLMTLGLALPVAAAITRPIDVLVRASAGYAATGKLPALATASFPPELERLGQALRTLVVELHRQRKELQQSHGRLVQALAAGRQIAWEYSVGQSTTRIEAFEGTWLGWSAGELADATGADWLAFVHPVDRAYVEAAMAGFVDSSDERIILQYRMRARDGGYRWVEDHALVIERSGDGRALRLAGTAIDIDEQKAIEQRLHESETLATLQLAELEALYQQAPIGLAVLDSEFRYLRINPYLARLNGRSPSDHIGRTVEEVLPDGGPLLQPLLRQVLDTGKPVEALELTFRARAPGEPEPTFVASYFPIKDLEGVTVAVGGICEDVTARKRAESAERAKAAFLATMSHEIRTPLTAILGFADLLAGAELAEEQRRQVAIIRETGRMLLAIINDILDFSKLEAGKASLEILPFGLRDLLSSTFEAARLLGAERGLAFRIEIDDAVPERVAGDATRLKQILTNLLGNAAKFTEKGGIVLRAAVAGTEEGRVRLRFEVEDTGIGVAPERLPRLFAMFEQADQSITRRFGGTGLGLAIAKRLADLMGGRIGARSTPGAGSTFWVELPFAAERAPVRSEPAQPGAAADVGLRRGRILVVDDVVTNRLLLDAVLRAHGQEVAFATDGVEAVEAAARAPFDLILMDVHMPHQDGLAATRAIRAGGGPNARAPIVALTAAVMAEEVAACRAAGMDGYLAKPVDRDGLQALLAAHVGARAAA